MFHEYYDSKMFRNTFLYPAVLIIIISLILQWNIPESGKAAIISTSLSAFTALALILLSMFSTTRMCRHFLLKGSCTLHDIREMRHVYTSVLVGSRPTDQVELPLYPFLKIINPDPVTSTEYASLRRVDGSVFLVKLRLHKSERETLDYGQVFFKKLAEFLELPFEDKTAETEKV